MTDTLADAIIYGDLHTVQDFLQREETDINDYDEYGYIPLVEAAIMDKMDIAEYLLSLGAKVDGTDLTGRTALHWAADNNNLDFCKLLLQQGANPNAYITGGFSVLVMPVLRKKHAIKQLLLEKGASLTFAQDYINTKLLGHRFELKGYADIVNEKKHFVEMEYEGFFLEFTMEIVEDSLTRFIKNFAARPYSPFFPYAKLISERLKIGTELISYQHHLLDVESIKNKIFDLFDNSPLFIPLGFDGHAICFIQLGDVLVKCDRGAASKRHGTVVFYRMHNPQLFNREFLKTLLYKRQSRRFIEDKLPEYLGLELFDTLPLPPQFIGNCSWANIEASVVAILYLLLQHQDNYQESTQGKNKELAMSFYHAWLEWDKDRALDEAISRFKHAGRERKASIAGILGAILFQTCDDRSEKGLERAEKILPILHTKGYEYVLQSYIKAYIYGLPDERGKKFHDLLDTCGVDIKKFR